MLRADGLSKSFGDLRAVAEVTLSLTPGAVTGLMTTIGGLGHTLPYLIPNFQVATSVAIGVVMIELWIIAWIRSRYMETPFWRAAVEVVVGGLLVFAVGIAIGSSGGVMSADGL